MINRALGLISYRVRKDRWKQHLYIKKRTDRAIRNHGLNKKNIIQDFMSWSWVCCNVYPSEQLKRLYPLIIDFFIERDDKKSRQYQLIIEKLYQLDFELSDGPILHQLYRIMLSYGQFTFGLHIRKKCEEVILISNSQLKPPFILEKGDFKLAKSIVKSSENKGLSAEKRQTIEWLSDILDSGNLASAHPIMNETDKLFYQIIEGKRIAVVGPITSDEEQGQEIDSYDLILRFNFKDDLKVENGSVYGLKTSLSYYSIAHSRALAKKNYKAIFKKLDCSSFVKSKARSFFDCKDFESRVSYDFRWLLPDTEFNIGPNAIFDLLRFKPSEIKIFNTDLMLTAGRAKGYWPSSVGNVDYIRSFIKTHDPVTQYQFLSHAFKAGLIHGDNRFCEVMNMGLEDYICKLQSVHGANFQKIEGPST